MRTDVKVGIALGAIVLIVAGAYYGANKEPDIQLAGADDEVREQNKRTLRDLLAPPPNTPTSLRNKTNAKSTSPTPNLKTRVPAGVVDTSASKAASKPFIDTARRNPDLTRKTSKDAEGPANASVPSENAKPAQELPTAETAPLIPTSIGGSADQRPLPARRTRPRDLVQSPTPTDARRMLGNNSRTTLREKPKKIIQARTHIVAAGDNFSALAERYYGIQSYAGLLVKANPNVDPRRMKIGSRIVIPPLNPDNREAPARSQDRAANTRHYYVQEGDSLYAIADARLGTGARWSEIYELNKTVIGADPSRLRVGAVLTLPAL